MLITEMIKQLEQIKNEHGDKEVLIVQDSDNVFLLAQQIELIKMSLIKESVIILAKKVTYKSASVEEINANNRND